MRTMTTITTITMMTIIMITEATVILPTFLMDQSINIRMGK